MTGPLGGGGQQDVVVRLRLEADKGNAGVVGALSAEIDKLRKQAVEGIKFGKMSGLSQSIEAEFNKASDAVGKNSKALADTWEKEIKRLSTSVIKAHGDEASAANKAADNKIAADNRFAKNRLAILGSFAQVEKQKETAAPRDERPVRNPERLLRRAETDQKGRSQKAVHEFGAIADDVGGLAKSIAILSDAKPESIDKLAKSFEKFKAIFDIFEHGLQLFDDVNKALETMKGLAAAAAVEQRLLAAATTSGGGGAAGQAAGAATGGVGAAAATYGAGALGGVAIAGKIAAIGVGLVAAGAVVQDLFVRVGRSLLLIDSRAESTAEAFLGWWQASERAAKGTKQIALLEEAQRARAQRIQEIDERVAKEGEARN